MTARKSIDRRLMYVKGKEIALLVKREVDYICLTDMAKFKNVDEPRFVIQNWMKSRYTVEFLGAWECLNNSIFNRIEFDTVKTSAGSNAFVLTPEKWVRITGAIGIISKAGRYGGGTFAHKDIAFEFASWLSPEFKLYLIKEFQRLKEDESNRKSLDWDLKRSLARINYRVHTDAIRDHLIPTVLTGQQVRAVYASEADILNMALFGKTAAEWRSGNGDKEGNIRDYATAEQLVVLSNLESINAMLLAEGLEQSARLKKMNALAITQMRSLLGRPGVKRLG